MSYRRPSLPQLLPLIAGLPVLVILASCASPRTLQFVNSCPFDVWIGGVGGAAECCGANGFCGIGRACGGTTASCPGGMCYWVLPQPTSNNGAGNPWQLTAGTGTATITLPPATFVSGGNAITWSGNVFGRTGCNPSTGTGCLTGDCAAGSDNNGGCGVGNGGTPPDTLAEFTLLNNGVDTYDISLVNGFNVPIQMAPAADGAYAPAPTCANCSDYWCVNAGGTSATSSAGNSTTLLGCPWTFTPPGPAYAYVAQGGDNCTLTGASSQCPEGQVCGLSIPAVAPQPKAPPTMQPTCGQQLGWWSADEVCSLSLGQAQTLGFNCSSSVPTSGGGYGTMSSLYQCTIDGSAAPSCYQDNADATCCGCANWTIDGGAVPATMQCVATNATWTQDVKPSLSFLKEACPMAYSYPYDDPTSTFTCQTSGGIPNAVDYVITFCPGGLTGL